MYEFSASSSFLLSQALATLTEQVKLQKPEAEVVEPWVQKHVKMVRSQCERAGLKVSLTLADMLVNYVSKMKPPIPYSAFGSQLDTMKEAVYAELKTMLFFRIDDQYAKYFREKCLFGEKVENDFSSASLDIEEAGKCLALGRPTASVFHLMRVMEVGLKALAKALAIPYAPSWESYITQIDTKITEKHKRKGIKWKRDEPGFRDVLGNLQSIKIA